MTDETTADEQFGGEFECDRCGYTCAAVVTARLGERRRRLAEAGADLATARDYTPDPEVARRAPEVAANAVAGRTLWFVPCPACGKRSSHAAGYQVQVAVGALLLGVAIGAIVLLGLLWRHAGERFGAGMLAIAGASAAVNAFAAYRVWRRPWVDVARRVTLRPPR